MVGALLGTILVGMVLGYMFFDVTVKPLLDESLMAALDFMGFVESIRDNVFETVIEQEEIENEHE